MLRIRKVVKFFAPLLMLALLIQPVQAAHWGREGRGYHHYLILAEPRSGCRRRLSPLQLQVLPITIAMGSTTAGRLISMLLSNLR